MDQLLILSQQKDSKKLFQVLVRCQHMAKLKGGYKIDNININVNNNNSTKNITRNQQKPTTTI